MSFDSKLRIAKVHIEETLDHLKRAGTEQKECVVLWVGKRIGPIEQVEAVLRPEHDAEDDWFHIPEESLRALFRELQLKGLVVLAQVHSHPKEAFHSVADDRLALVRRRGALSLVIPYFAQKTSVENFLDHVAAFSLSGPYVWEEIEGSAVFNRVEAY